MKRNLLLLLLAVLLTCEVAAAQLTEYKTTDTPGPGENIAQPCDYQATFPMGAGPVKAAWVTYDRGQDITRFYSDPAKPLSPMKTSFGWYGSIRVCDAVHKDHWGLPLWNVCDAHVAVSEKSLPTGEMPAGYFNTEKLAQEWLSYIKEPDHPKNSFPRPDDPTFGEPK
jgi:hypothetical protein